MMPLSSLSSSVIQHPSNMSFLATSFSRLNVIRGILSCWPGCYPVLIEAASVEERQSIRRDSVHERLEEQLVDDHSVFEEVELVKFHLVFWLQGSCSAYTVIIAALEGVRQLFSGSRLLKEIISLLEGSFHLRVTVSRRNCCGMLHFKDGVFAEVDERFEFTLIAPVILQDVEEEGVFGVANLLFAPLFEPTFLDFEVDLLDSLTRAHDFNSAQEWVEVFQ
ncbi:hypothetical protein WR25_15932 [Diploscapter pachys]|uniref:Uncharacterized protein n=1 Tax=Diploscapter pachys TaxID=2018661 RepID=A0A2A2JN04_9BILA|nr:hypothetical protein WR25_15932 [Diploscapter pachys]